MGLRTYKVTLSLSQNSISAIQSSHSPVRYFDDVVCELHALEGHGLPLHASAGTIDKSLEDTNAHKSI